MYSFGKNSKEKLDTCHPDLILIMEMAISVSLIDFGISEGNRSVERQFQLYNEGKSKINGITKKGKHNLKPSLAVDIYTYHPILNTRRKLAYDKIHLAYLSGVIQACSVKLYNEGKIKYLIRWGANWNSNGVIDYDQAFDDYPHFELAKP